MLYHEFVLTSKNFIRTVTQAAATADPGWQIWVISAEVRGEWLLEIAPSYYEVRPGILAVAFLQIQTGDQPRGEESPPGR